LEERDITLSDRDALFGQGLVGLCAISRESVNTMLNEQGKDAEGQFDPSIDTPTGYTPTSVLCGAVLLDPRTGCIGVMVIYDKKGPFGDVVSFSAQEPYP
jgi:hypothetical protein